MRRTVTHQEATRERPDRTLATHAVIRATMTAQTGAMGRDGASMLGTLTIVAAWPARGNVAGLFPVLLVSTAKRTGPSPTVPVGAVRSSTVATRNARRRPSLGQTAPMDKDIAGDCRGEG